MELIDENLIEVNATFDTRQIVISNFANTLYQNQRIDDIDGFLKDVYKRENEVSTSMGFGVAIPHTQSKHVLEPSLVFIKLEHEIQWNEDNNIEFIFGIAVPLKNQNDRHLKILSSLARKLMDDEFRSILSDVHSKQEGLSFLKFLNTDI